RRHFLRRMVLPRRVGGSGSEVAGIIAGTQQRACQHGRKDPIRPHVPQSLWVARGPTLAVERLLPGYCICLGAVPRTMPRGPSNDRPDRQTPVAVEEWQVRPLRLVRCAPRRPPAGTTTPACGGARRSVRAGAPALLPGFVRRASRG